MKRIIGILVFLLLLMLTGFASAEFIDNGDVTITDTRTSLMWFKSITSANFEQAKDFCAMSTIAGYEDWRLPTITELQLLFDSSQCGLTNSLCYGGWHWSASEDDESVWIVSPNTDYLYFSRKTGIESGRCVRGASIPTNCDTLENNMDISIPCLDYNGIQYIVKMKYYTNSSLPEGVYWKMESIQEK